MKKIFTNDKFFLSMVLSALIGEGLFTLISIFIWKDTNVSRIILLIRLACVLILYISYKKHSKNVMKGMMGALLMAELITSITIASYSQPLASFIDAILGVIVVILMFINHFYINSDHKSSPFMIRINQLLLICLFIMNAVGDIIWAVAFPDVPYIIPAFILDIIGYGGMNAVVVCVESRLDAYRLDREAAGWTEEAGYPEGYVHQKDR